MKESLSLVELQERFTQCLLDNSCTAKTLPLLESASPTNNKRLDVYRNNVFHSLKNALSDLYPAFRRLTGDDFFNGTAITYLKEHLPTQAAMVYFGSSFPDFLEQFTHTKEHKWLADVARLELACHQSYHETDVSPLDPASLKTMPAEKLANMSAKLLPSLRLINSPYPVYKIWLANQDNVDSDETINLDSGGESLCVYRPEFDVLIKTIDSGTFVFLTCLSQGLTLENAIIRATDSDAEFIADKVLSECFAENLFEIFLEIK